MSIISVLVRNLSDTKYEKVPDRFNSMGQAGVDRFIDTYLSIGKMKYMFPRCVDRDYKTYCDEYEKVYRINVASILYPMYHRSVFSKRLCTNILSQHMDTVVHNRNLETIERLCRSFLGVFQVEYPVDEWKAEGVDDVLTTHGINTTDIEWALEEIENEDDWYEIYDSWISNRITGSDVICRYYNSTGNVEIFDSRYMKAKNCEKANIVGIDSFTQDISPDYDRDDFQNIYQYQYELDSLRGVDDGGYT